MTSDFVFVEHVVKDICVYSSGYTRRDIRIVFGHNSLFLTCVPPTAFEIHKETCMTLQITMAVARQKKKRRPLSSSIHV
jgi:hypothetical protein